MRSAKYALIACAVLAVLWLCILFSNTARLAVARSYFRLENAWVARWPVESQRYAIQRLTPVLCRAGLLRPVRMRVEPRVSFLLDPRDLVAVTILRTKEWQPQVWEALSPALSEGAVLIDVGAHIGYFSIKGSVKVGSTGRVVAFEPNPETLALLRQNVAVNRAGNVIVEPVACTDREQMLTLYAAPAINTGASSLARENADVSTGQSPKAYSVRGRPIDDVIREVGLSRVDAIKIDVEGAEVMVLRGAADTLKRFHPKVVIEEVPSQLATFHATVDDIASAFRAAGYNHHKPVDDTDWEWTFVGASNSANTVRVADTSASAQLIRGFHGLEQNAWRWTERDFTVALRTPQGASQRGASLTLNLTVPDVSIRQLKNLALRARVGGIALAPEVFTTPGDRVYRRDIPAAALTKDVIDVDFSLDKALSPTASDPRELGVIVTSVSLEAK